MTLPGVESTWCAYLGASTRAVYPRHHGDIKVTLVSSNRRSLVMWQVTVLIEAWFDPATGDRTSEDDALDLHAKVLAADSAPGLRAHITAVSPDVPQQNDDPDSPLDRWQFLTSHNIRTVP